MATYTSNFALTKPAYGEAADIAVINGNMDEIDEIMHDNRYMMASAWDSATTYNKGDFAIYENSLYRCTTNGTSGNWDASKWTLTVLADNVGSVTVSKTASGNPIELSDGANAPMVSCVTEIQGYQSGTGTPSPDNVRPITAYTEGEISVGDGGSDFYSSSGVEGFNSAVNATIISNDSFRITTLSSGNYRASKQLTSDFSDFVVGKTYTVEADATITSGCAMLSMRNASNGVIANGGSTPITSNGHLVMTFKFTSEMKFISFFCTWEGDGGTNGDVTYSNIRMYEGNLKTSYTTTFPSAIYRGSEDVAEGEVTVTHKLVNMGTLNWAYDSTNDFFYTLISERKAGASFISSQYNNIGEKTDAEMTSVANGSIASNPGGKYINVKDTRFIDAAAFTTAMDGVQLAYELNTPATSSVTVSNSPIRTLSGYNHIESSTGDMEVEYITKTYEPIIKAAEKELGEISEHYSTSERVVGKWIDGKTLYEKTFTRQLSGNRLSIDISDLDIEMAFIVSGYYDIGVTCISLNEYMTASAFSYTHINPGTTPPIIDCNCFIASNATVYVTIRYTKNA